MRTTLFIALVMLATSARADVVDIRWSHDRRFTHDGVIPAGKFVEICGKIPAGAKVLWEFKAGALVDFNVHYHQAKEVIYPVKLAAVATAKDILATTSEQEYCWMWSNKSDAAATLTVELAR